MWNASELTQERGDNITQRQSRMAAHLLGCPLDNIRRSWKRLTQRLTEAVNFHGDDCTFHVNGHILTRLPPLFTVIVRRVPLPRNWSTIFVIPGYAIDQSCIDEKKVDPNFVVAALVCAPAAKRAVGDSQGTLHTNLPLLLGPRRFYEPTYISPLTWHVSWSPQRCGARRNR